MYFTCLLQHPICKPNNLNLPFPSWEEFPWKQSCLLHLPLYQKLSPRHKLASLHAATRETNPQNGLNFINSYPELRQPLDQSCPFIHATSSSITAVLHTILVSLLLPPSCSPPWNSSFSSALASELLIRCQMTQRCCHLQRPFWSLKAVALKYLLLDVVSRFGLPNSLAPTQKLCIALYKHRASSSPSTEAYGLV